MFDAGISDPALEACVRASGATREFGIADYEQEVRL